MTLWPQMSKQMQVTGRYLREFFSPLAAFLLGGRERVKVTLKDRHSVLIGDRRLVNDSGRPIELVVLHENNPLPFEIDSKPYPRKGERREVTNAKKSA